MTKGFSTSLKSVSLMLNNSVSLKSLLVIAEVDCCCLCFSGGPTKKVSVPIWEMLIATSFSWVITDSLLPPPILICALLVIASPTPSPLSIILLSFCEEWICLLPFMYIYVSSAMIADIGAFYYTCVKSTPVALSTFGNYSSDPFKHWVALERKSIFDCWLLLLLSLLFTSIIDDTLPPNLGLSLRS